MRILSLRYGADLVWSPETIDKRLMTSTRIVNETLGTVDFIDAKQTLCLRVHPSEKNKLVIQLGSACPILAGKLDLTALITVRAAKLVEQDCGAIELNCGCPKPFSISGNMGAALLSNQPLLLSILTALVQQTSLLVTCKIRNLETVQETIELMQKIESTGVSAIAVHFRTRGMKSTVAAMWERIEEVCGCVKVPVFVNGDLFSAKDVADVSQRASKVGFMIARAAQSNPFVFHEMRVEIDRKRREAAGESVETVVPKKLTEVMREYAKVCMQYDMPIQNAKFVLCQFAPARSSKLHGEVCEELRIKYYHGDVAKIKDYDAVAKLFGLEVYYKSVLDARNGTDRHDNGDYTSEYLYVPDGVVLPVYERNVMCDKRKADVLA